MKKKFNFNDLSKYITIAYIIASAFLFKEIFKIEDYFISNGFGESDKRDYLYIFLGIFISAFIFKFTSWAFDSFIRRNKLDKSRRNESTEWYVYRIKNMVYGIFYYGLGTIINFYLIKTYSPEFLPKYMGGNLDVLTFADSWPRTPSKPVSIFFIITIGKD